MDPNFNRIDEFNGGVNAAAQPRFRTMQQSASLGGMTGATYSKVSVLDNMLPSGNGYSAVDRNRLSPYANAPVLKAQNGVSEGTYQKQQWLESKFRTVG